MPDLKDFELKPCPPRGTACGPWEVRLEEHAGDQQRAPLLGDWQAGPLGRRGRVGRGSSREAEKGSVLGVF